MRTDYVRELMKYMKVDSYGACLHIIGTYHTITIIAITTITPSHHFLILSMCATHAHLRHCTKANRRPQTPDETNCQSRIVIWWHNRQPLTWPSRPGPALGSRATAVGPFDGVLLCIGTQLRSEPPRRNKVWLGMRSRCVMSTTTHSQASPKQPLERSRPLLGISQFLVAKLRWLSQTDQGNHRSTLCRHA